MAADVAGVIDDFFFEGGHERGGDGHVLDGKAVGVHAVVFADLRGVIEVFLFLDGSAGGLFDGFYAVEPGWVGVSERADGLRRRVRDVEGEREREKPECDGGVVLPFCASSTDVACHDDTEWEPVDFGKWLAIHFPCQEDFVQFDFTPGNRDDIVHHMAFFEVSICAIQFEMLGSVFQAAAGFDDFLQADACPSGCADCTFAPWSVDQFVSVTRVQVDLFESSGTGAL